MYIEGLIEEIQELGEVDEVAVHFKQDKKGNVDYNLWVKGKNGYELTVPCTTHFSLKVQELSVVAVQLVLSVITGEVCADFNMNEAIKRACEMYPYKGNIVINEELGKRGFPKELRM